MIVTLCASQNGDSALHIASKNDDVMTVRTLLDRGADVNGTDAVSQVIPSLIVCHTKEKVSETTEDFADIRKKKMRTAAIGSFFS